MNKRERKTHSAQAHNRTGTREDEFVLMMMAAFFSIRDYSIVGNGNGKPQKTTRFNSYTFDAIESVCARVHLKIYKMCTPYNLTVLWLHLLSYHWNNSVAAGKWHFGPLPSFPFVLWLFQSPRMLLKYANNKWFFDYMQYWRAHFENIGKPRVFVYVLHIYPFCCCYFCSCVCVSTN